MDAGDAGRSRTDFFFGGGVMSADATAQVDRRDSLQTSPNGGRQSKCPRALAECAAGDGLTQEAMEALRITNGWRRWVQVRSHLGGLDLRNQILIAHQRPGAHRVASSGQWLRSGHEVRGDDTPIHVWAHVPASKSALRKWKWAGSPPEDKPMGDLRLVPVFDQDQVTPLAPSPEDGAESPPHSGEAHNLIRALGQLIKFSSEIGAPVDFEPLAGPVRGCHEPGTGAIVIDASPDFPPLARAQRLLYELASVLIDEDPRRRFLKVGAEEREALAGSVECCVSRSAGLRRSGNPIAVPSEWSREGASVAVGYAALVDRVARRLEVALRRGLDGEPK